MDPDDMQPDPPQVGVAFLIRACPFCLMMSPHWHLNPSSLVPLDPE